MSEQLISRSADLKRLRDEGYDIEVRSGYLIVKDVPYVNSNKEVMRGILLSELTLAGDVTTRPNTHVALFAGEYPCDKDGTPLEKIRHQSAQQSLGDNLAAQHSFSAKPVSGGYENYHEKVVTYVGIISGPAQTIDRIVTAQTFAVIPASESESVFNYIDTASSRANINLISKKLALGKIAIVGVGGTGSYVLDLVAKTPVKEIHIFDRDVFLQHNAFRSPGAPSIDDLRTAPEKVDYFKNLYSKMHRGVVPHACHIDASNIEQLREMDFVFLCIEGGDAKKPIIEKLEEFDIRFIDVGMGIDLVDDSLLGILRVTTSTPEQRGHLRKRISLADAAGHDEYDRNIQIADLNALNAALAVIKWKKLLGFYLDLDREHQTTFTVDGNMLINEDRL